MKKISGILFLLIITVTTAWAQDARSILKVRLSDFSLITIELDGRRFNKVADKLTVADLPAGRHYLKLYRYRPYQDGKGGKAELLYDGNIRIAPYTVAYCIVDARKGRLRFFDRDADGSYTHLDREFDGGNNAAAGGGAAPAIPGDAGAPPPPPPGRPQPNGTIYNKSDLVSEKDMSDLKKLAADRITDSDKMKLLQNELKAKYYTTEQVRTIISWLSFESSRLEFAKWAFNRVTDRGNYRMLEREFTFSSSKEEFNNYINGR